MFYVMAGFDPPSHDFFLCEPSKRFLRKLFIIHFMKQTTIIISLICFLYACTSHYSPEMETVLQQAGKNRRELEKVWKYFGKNTADSLKLRAAEFLIVNMPGKYSEYYDAPWNDVSAVMLRWTSSPNIQMVLDTYRIGEPVRKDDMEHITADYLISNIELAFKVWQEMPWGKDIPFLLVAILGNKNDRPSRIFKNI